MISETDKYTYRVTWSGEDGEFVGLCAEFSKLSWLAESPQAALKGICSLVSDCTKDMIENGEDIPKPIATRQYSGKFMVRIPPGVHRQLVTEAAESGVSLNRLASAKLAH